MELKKLEIIFEDIIAEYQERRNAKNEMIAVKILELLIQCDRFYAESQSISNDRIYSNTIEQFNELLEKHVSEKRTVKFYADALYLNPNHLNFLSKAYGSHCKRNHQQQGSNNWEQSLETGFKYSGSL